MLTARANHSRPGIRALLCLVFVLALTQNTAGAVREIINRSEAEFLNPLGHWNSFTSAPVSVLIADQSTGLFVQKTASRQTAELGDFLDYSLQIRNVSSNVMSVVTVTDSLPAGFRYQRGTTRFNGTRARDPTG